MKNTIIHGIFFIVVCLLFIGLQAQFGFYNSILFCGPLIALTLFANGWVKAKGSLWGYIRLLHKRITYFITNTAVNYNSTKWYRLPKYWLVMATILWLSGQIFINVNYGFGDFSFGFVTCGFFVVLLPFLLRGYRSAFYMLLLPLGFVSYGIINRAQYLPWHCGAAFVWVLAWAYLIFLCIRIERQKDKLHPHKKPIVQDTIISLGLLAGIVVAFVVCFISERRATKQVLYSDCMKHMTAHIEAAQQNPFCECFCDNMYETQSAYINSEKWHQIVNLCKLNLAIKDPQAGCFE